ncbi:MAG: DUF882 domain-containing protein [Alphaproteobacteria bacterium]|nr:DUF882 domain-containing protein [Alphaproteobacteria bacterium]
MSALAPVVAGGETRTISLYHIHTGESLTVTYMKDGRYVPSAMKQINYLLRDWRKDQTITIDPRTIDLVWELHEDLGSHAPIHIVCGYRSPATNAMLHRIGRHVAKESQHMHGKAIDFYLTDVPTLKIRNVALVRQVGGVGYYRSAGGPTGFLHVDSGHVRHWGPYISPSQMAMIFRDGKKFIGRHMTHGGSFSTETEVASADDKKSPPGFISKLFGLGKKPIADDAAPSQVAAAAPADKGGIYNATGQSDMADLSADASEAPAKPAIKPKGTAVSEDQMASLGDLAQDASQNPKAKAAKAAIVADAGDEGDGADAPDATVTQGRVVPKPRLKPVEIMLMAAANMKAEPKMIRINAASAPPPSQTGKDLPSPVADSLGTLMQAAAEDTTIQKPLTKGKSSLATELRNGNAKGVPVIKPMIASAGGSDINWWPQLFLQNDAAIRRDGQPPLIGAVDQDALPKAAKLDGTVATGAMDQEPQHAAEGKGDLMVNEQDKVDLGSDQGLAPLPMKIGALDN